MVLENAPYIEFLIKGRWVNQGRISAQYLRSGMSVQKTFDSKGAEYVRLREPVKDTLIFKIYINGADVTEGKSFAPGFDTVSGYSVDNSRTKPYAIFRQQFATITGNGCVNPQTLDGGFGSAAVVSQSPKKRIQVQHLGKCQ